MKEEQKVYIRGSKNRPDDVRKYLNNIGVWIEKNYIIIILSILIASAPFIGALIGKYSVKTSTNNNVEINK